MSAGETAIRIYVFKIDHNHKTQGSKPKKIVIIVSNITKVRR